MNLLELIVKTINDNSNKYRATLSENTEPYVFVNGKKLETTACRVIIMSLLDSYGRCGKGNYIYEIDIQKVVRRLSQKDKSFSTRINNLELTLLDIEIIIRQASNQMIKPYLAKTALDIYLDNP